VLKRIDGSIVPLAIPKQGPFWPVFFRGLEEGRSCSGKRNGKKNLVWEEGMPFVNIKITKDGATVEQKARLIREATAMLQNVLGKNPATTVVVIDEVDPDNWGIGAETVTARRKKGA
jgi:4-oxalocrotonate tautomerase